MADDTFDNLFIATIDDSGSNVVPTIHDQPAGKLLAHKRRAATGAAHFRRPIVNQTKQAQLDESGLLFFRFVNIEQ